MPVWTHYFAHFVVTVIATIAFGITFQVPRRHYLAAGITGAVGWMVYIFGVELLGMSPAIATPKKWAGWSTSSAWSCWA